jgi:hypothetical protein
LTDFAFIAGDFLFGDLPQGKEYLAHYFKGEVETVFLSYIFMSPHVYTKDPFKQFYGRFCDHTGKMCSTRWIRKLLKRLNDIETTLEHASKNFDLSLVGAIKSGKASF